MLNKNKNILKEFFNKKEKTKNIYTDWDDDNLNSANLILKKYISIIDNQLKINKNFNSVFFDLKDFSILLSNRDKRNLTTPYDKDVYNLYRKLYFYIDKIDPDFMDFIAESSYRQSILKHYGFQMDVFDNLDILG
jgi:hypothetical protein